MQGINEALEQGVAAHRANRFDEALASYRSALAIAPDDVEILSLIGLALVGANRLAEALSFLQQAVKAEPDQPGFRLNLAEGFIAAKDYRRALAELEAAIVIDQDNARAWERVGDIADVQEKPEQAAVAWQRARTLAPTAVSPALKLARMEINRAHFDVAKELLDAVEAQAKDTSVVFLMRRDMLIAQRDWPALEAMAASWSQTHSDGTEAWRGLARATFEQGRYREAMVVFSRVVSAGPPQAGDLTAYAGLCLHALDLGAAAAALDQAESLDPDLPELLAKRALLHMYFGRFGQAESYCRRCLARDPENVSAYSILSRLMRGHLEDAESDSLARMAHRPDLHLDHRIPAAFAAAHACDARGDFDGAFAAYEYAHGLSIERDRREHRSYNRDEDEMRTRRLIAKIPRRSRQLPTGRVAGPRPIFIVGMPRSGTTLIESVLGAHSRIFACGERPAMRQILQAFLKLDAAGFAPDDGTLCDWSAAYLEELPDLGGADHVTDKHPLNFESIGLIKRLFPGAGIIHVRRNPVETCLSIFRQEFNKQWTFAHQLTDIGRFYGHYCRLIAHWERCFPGWITTVQYEDFAANFPQSATALVQACGLAWEPQCLEFQSSAHPIATFSTVQARDPVAVRNGRAQYYHRHLEPLIETLSAAGVDLATGAPRQECS